MNQGSRKGGLEPNNDILTTCNANNSHPSQRLFDVATAGHLFLQNGSYSNQESDAVVAFSVCKGVTAIFAEIANA